MGIIAVVTEEERVGRKYECVWFLLLEIAAPRPI